MDVSQTLHASSWSARVCRQSRRFRMHIQVEEHIWNYFMSSLYCFILWGCASCDEAFLLCASLNF